MIKLTVALALLLSAPAMAQAADTAAAGQASPPPVAMASHAREIVDTIMPPERQSAMINEMVAVLAGQMRESMGEGMGDAGVRQIVDRHLAKTLDRVAPATERYLPVLREAMVAAYVREFSAAELADVARFARTPAGRHYLSRSTTIMSDPAIAAANRSYFAEAQAVNLASQSELQADLMAYLRKHPDVARKIADQAKAQAAKP